MIVRRLILVATILLPAIVRADGRRVIIVPTELGGFFTGRDVYRRDVDLALRERLRASQFSVATRSPLSATESACRELDCLARIAEIHGTGLVVAGRILNDGAVTLSYRVRIRVAENNDAKVATREREKECSNCTEGQARDMLATLMSAVIANEPEPASPPMVMEPPLKSPPPNDGALVKPRALPNNPPPVIGSSSSAEDRLSRGQRLALRGVGFGLVGVGVLGLIQGFVELRHNGDVVDSSGKDCSSCSYHLETGKGQALFFTLGSVVALGGAAMAIVSWIHLPKQPREHALTILPAVSPTGAQLQIRLTF
jgi:hypothetical protein